MVKKKPRPSNEELLRNQAVAPHLGPALPERPLDLANQIATVGIHVRVAALAVPLMKATPPDGRRDLLRFPNRDESISLADLWNLIDDEQLCRSLMQEHESIILRTIPLQLHELVRSYCGFVAKGVELHHPLDWAQYEKSSVYAVGRFLRTVVGHSTSGFIETWPNGLPDIVEWREKRWTRADVKKELLIHPIEYLHLCADYESLVRDKFEGGEGGPYQEG